MLLVLPPLVPPLLVVLPPLLLVLPPLGVLPPLVVLRPLLVVLPLLVVPELRSSLDFFAVPVGSTDAVGVLAVGVDVGVDVGEGGGASC